jgi:hypothetical protein
MIVEDNRTGVMVVRDRSRLIAVWSNCYQVSRQLFPDEYECLLRVRIHRGGRGAPILLTKRGRRSSFLTGRTLRRFELDTGLQVKAIELRDLDSRADGEFGRKWAALHAAERLQVLEWIAEG